MSEKLESLPNRPLYIPEVRRLHDDEDTPFEIAPMTIIPEAGVTYLVVIETETKYTAAGYDEDEEAWLKLASDSIETDRDAVMEEIDEAAMDWVDKRYGDDYDHTTTDQMDLDTDDIEEPA